MDNPVGQPVTLYSCHNRITNGGVTVKRQKMKGVEFPFGEYSVFYARCTEHAIQSAPSDNKSAAMVRVHKPWLFCPVCEHTRERVLEWRHKK